MENLELDIDDGSVFSSLQIKTHKTDGSVQSYYGLLYKNSICVDTTHNYCSPCFLCRRLKRYKHATSSGNLRAHLSNEHGIDAASKNRDIKQRKLSEMFGLKDKTTTEGSSGSQAIVMHPIGNSFQLSRQITLWLCRDLLPFNTIAHSGFQDFCVGAKIVKSAGNLSSTRTLALTALDDVYQVTYAEFLKKIKNFPTVISVTFDFWTDNVKRSSYITFTGHWIENFTMVSVVFKTEAFLHPHTGEQIQAAFEDLKTEFGLREKTILAVTDGGSNVINACRLMQIDRMQCIAHGIHNLIIHDLLENEEMTHKNDAIKKIKKMLMALTYKYDELTKVHSNAIDKKLVDLIDIAVSLQEVFEAEDSVRVHEEDKELFNVLNDRTPFKTLKNSNSTRWNSTLLMLESVLANQDVVSDCLHLIKRYDVMLNAEEMQLAKDITAVLKKFAVATDFFQGQKYPTLNTVLLFLTDLKSSLRTYLNDSSSDVIKKASEILLSGIDKRFPVTETQVVAAFLDPSMQNLAAINTYLSEKQQSMAEILENLWQKFDPIKSRQML